MQHEEHPSKSDDPISLRLPVKVFDVYLILKIKEEKSKLRTSFTAESVSYCGTDVHHM